MPLDSSLTLGPFIVDADGRLSPCTPDRFPAFSVIWRGHLVQARLAAADGHAGTLVLQAALGRVPSTGRAEAPGTVPRQIAFATLRALPAALPEGWRLALRPDHRIFAEAQLPIDLPVGAAELLTDLTLFLLRLSPFLDLLEEGVGVEREAVARPA
jgi:hypothetical protein